MSRKSKNSEALARVKACLKRPENQRCADCGVNDPKWGSVTLGVFVCLNCSGRHRNLGTHITFIRSCTLDDWTPEQAYVMESIGNVTSNQYYEANLPANYPRPDPEDIDGLTKFITLKYDRKKWADTSRRPPHEELASPKVARKHQHEIRSSSQPQFQQEQPQQYQQQYVQPQPAPVQQFTFQGAQYPQQQQPPQQTFNPFFVQQPQQQQQVQYPPSAAFYPQQQQQRGFGFGQPAPQPTMMQQQQQPQQQVNLGFQQVQASKISQSHPVFDPYGGFDPLGAPAAIPQNQQQQRISNDRAALKDILRSTNQPSNFNQGPSTSVFHQQNANDPFGTF